MRKVVGTYITRVGDMRYAYKILVGKSEGLRPFGRRWCGWEDNNRMYLREIGGKF